MEQNYIYIPHPTGFTALLIMLTNVTGIVEMDTKFDLLKAKVVFSHEVYLYTVYILSNT